jgi:hypothetical protein
MEVVAAHIEVLALPRRREEEAAAEPEEEETEVPAEPQGG